VPQLDAEQEIDHVTAVFEVPLTVAVNCWVPPDCKLADAGETDRVTVAGGLPAPPLPPPLTLLVLPPPPQAAHSSSSPTTGAILAPRCKFTQHTGLRNR
jgi:hypothetical protein